MTEEETSSWVNETYQEVVGWSAGNLFEPPKCAATTKVAKEMAALITSFTQDKPLAPYALKIFFVLPKLFFQKTHGKTGTSENVTAVTRRVDLWFNNNFAELLEEARTIQRRLPGPSLKNRGQDDKARSFADRMRQGNVSSALRTLDDGEAGGVLPLNRETIRQLREKHPPPSASVGLRLPGRHIPPNPVIYEMITRKIIRKKSLQTHGMREGGVAC